MVDNCCGDSITDFEWDTKITEKAFACPGFSKLKKKKKTLYVYRKVMTNLDSMLKSRDITLQTKFCLVKAMVFPVVMDVRIGL